MRPATFDRIRASILQKLAQAPGPVHATSLVHHANSDYDRVREVRRALEAEGLIRTFKDRGARNHPLMAELVRDPREFSSMTKIELRDALIVVRTDDTTWVLSSVTGTLALNANIEPGAERHYLLAPGLPAHEKSPDKITGYGAVLTATLPGYIFHNHKAVLASLVTPLDVPKTDQKEG